MNICLENFRLSTLILLFTLLLGSIITSCSFFAQHDMSMGSNTDISMHIDAATPACCQMASHHNPFQNVVADIVNRQSGVSNNFALTMIFVFLFTSFWLIADKPLSTYLYRLRRILSITSNYLLQAFSQGILQPQIYNA